MILISGFDCTEQESSSFVLGNTNFYPAVLSMHLLSRYASFQFRTIVLEDTKPKLSTTSVQTITSEFVKDEMAVVCAESDLAEPGLRGVVTGHQVNGAMLAHL